MEDPGSIPNPDLKHISSFFFFPLAGLYKNSSEQNAAFRAVPWRGDLWHLPQAQQLGGPKLGISFQRIVYFDQLFMCCIVVYSDQLLVGSSYTVISYHNTRYCLQLQNAWIFFKKDRNLFPFWGWEAEILLCAPGSVVCKYWRSSVPTRDSSSRRLKVGDLSRVEAK